MQMAQQHNNILSFKGIDIDPFEIAMDMSEGCLTEIKELYFIDGKYAPIVRWCAFSQPDWPEQLLTLFDFWNANAQCDTPKEMFEILPKYKAHQGYYAYFRPMAGGADYMSLYNGEDILGFSDFPVKQSVYGQLPTKQEVKDLFHFCAFQASAIRGQPLLCMSQGTDKEGFPLVSTQLIAPFFTKQNTVTGIWVCGVRMP
jgi:hypothetical protein